MTAIGSAHSSDVMALCLAGLAPQVLDEILSFNGSNLSVIPLYLTGDKSLMHKIELSITSMSLQSRELYNNRFLPKLLEKLRSVREFRLSSIDYILYGPVSIVSSLKLLSSTLTKLEIRMIPSTYSGELSELLDGRSPDSLRPLHRFALIDPLINAIPSFPNLRSLLLSEMCTLTVSDVKRLPSSLTELGASFLVKEYLEVAAALPQSLQRLKIARRDRATFSAEFYAALPRSLVSIIISQNHALNKEIVESLPRTLTELDGPHLSGLNSAAVSCLPPDLTSLAASSYADPTELESALRLLPSSLKTLELSLSGVTLTSHLIRVLPRSLLTLKSNLDLSEVGPKDWPPCLTELSSQAVTSFTESAIASLPQSLRSFCLFGVTLADPSLISILPKSITRLELSIGPISTGITFPPLLATLALRCKNGKDMPLPLLPSTLTSLNLPNTSIKGADLIHLPPRLRMLCLNSLDPTNYNPLDPAHIERARELAQIGLEEDGTNRAALPPKTLKRASMFRLLPRTLESLQFYILLHPDRLKPKDWAKLPNLTLLSISTDINPDALLYIPTKRLCTILIVLQQLHDKHVKALPRQLRPSSIIVSTYHLTPKAVKYAPRNQNPQWIPNDGFLKLSENLARRRLAAYMSSDPCELERLLTPKLISMEDLQALE